MDQTGEQGQGWVQDAPIPGLVPAPFAAPVVAQPAEVAAQTPAQPSGRISPARAFGELGLVYFVSFGLGVISAIGLLTDPSLGANQVIRTGVEAGAEMMQYIMQAAVVVLGVGYFSLRRGLTLRTIFGRFTKRTPPVMYYPPQYGAQYPYPYPNAYPAQPYGSGYPAYAAYPQAGYAPSGPTERGPGWQFSRAFFLSMAGVLAFLITVVIYIQVTGQSTGAPDQGNSLWMVPVGIVVALSAGFGEEVLITGMVVTTLEQAGFARRAWVIYLVAICLRIPFHLYYGWASLGVICFTVVNVWVYRRWRLLWPIVLAHAMYDAVEFAGSLVPNLAGLALLGLGLATFVMVIVIACVELSDRSARRRFNQWRAAVGV